ncbi:MAG TPA: hypothetical protein VH475_12425 [Tepidisphaeraceae bacterium]|jgi:hypothetical protein
MFGNRLGWGISVALTGLILLLVWQVIKLNAVSPPSQGLVARTGSVSLNLLASPQKLDPIRLPFDAQAILPGMTDPADAAPFYRDIIQAYKADPYTYRDLFETGKPRTTNLKDLPAFESLDRARNCRSMRLFATNPGEVIGYKFGGHDPTEAIEALYNVGKAASRLAQYIQSDQPRQALNLAEAVFALGAKMAQERVRYREFDAGAELLREGAYLIAKLDRSRAGAAGAVDGAMKQLLRDQVVPLWTVLSSVDPNVIGRTAGDVFYVAKNSREPMWRVEATLKLGMLKYIDGARRGDQRWAEITVKRMANDATQDPAVRAAARAAHDLTVEEFRMLGG